MKRPSNQGPKEMQITLNQAEIETAIKKYVNDQVVIREDQDITIDLKAGRGPEGFTANIEIVPIGPVKPSPETSAAQTTPSKPLGIAKAASKPVISSAVPDAPEKAAKTKQEAPRETAAESGANATEDDQGQEEAAASPSGDKPKSLFSNLAKPRN